jgi:hypothetical protein
MKMPSKTKRANDSNNYGGGGGLDDMISRAQNELEQLGASLTIPIHLDIVSAVVLARSLQVMLRVPVLPNITRQTVRLIVDGIRDTMRAAGYTAHADFLDTNELEESQYIV